MAADKSKQTPARYVQFDLVNDDPNIWFHDGKRVLVACKVRELYETPEAAELLATAQESTKQAIQRHYEAAIRKGASHG